VARFRVLVVGFMWLWPMTTSMRGATWLHAAAFVVGLAASLLMGQRGIESRLDSEFHDPMGTVVVVLVLWLMTTCCGIRFLVVASSKTMTLGGALTGLLGAFVISLLGWSTAFEGPWSFGVVLLATACGIVPSLVDVLQVPKLAPGQDTTAAR
jgi:hypothetical protein